MLQTGPSLSWIGKLIGVVAIMCIALGAALSHTDLFNFNASAASARAKDQETAYQAQKNALDLEVYQAQKDAEAVAQQQATVVQQAKGRMDQQLYLIQTLAQAEKQIADAEQYRAQRASQVGIERERQLAQIRVWEQDQNRQQAEAEARATQSRELARAVSDALIAALVIVSLAVAVSLVTFAIIGARRHSQVMPPRSAQDVAPIPMSAEEQVSTERRYWKEKRIQARANEIASRTVQQVQQQAGAIARGPTPLDVGIQRRKNGKHPIAPSASVSFALLRDQT